MSAYLAPTHAGPAAGTLEQQLRQMRAELARTARQNQEAVFPAVLLVAPNGRVWRVSVTDTGSLVTAPVQQDPAP